MGLLYEVMAAITLDTDRQEGELRRLLRQLTDPAGPGPADNGPDRTEKTEEKERRVC